MNSIKIINKSDKNIFENFLYTSNIKQYYTYIQGVPEVAHHVIGGSTG